MKILTMISGLILFFTVSSGHAKTLVWSSASDGNWNSSGNWSPHNVPGAGDIAIITNSGTFTVSLTADASVDALILGATNIAGSQTLQLNGNTLTVGGQGSVGSSGIISGGILAGNWVYSGTTMFGVLTMATNSVLNLTSANGTIYFSGSVLTNYGTVNWSNVDISAASAPSASQIFNYGLWDCQTNNTLIGSASTNTTFNNYGVFRKSGGAFSGFPYLTSLDNNVLFNNFGIMDVQIGGINVYQGTGNGTFIITNKSGLYLGNYNLTNDPTFSGAGILQGYVTGNNAVVHGTENFNYGAFYGTLTLASNNVLTIGGFNGAQGSIGLNGLVLTNYGTVNWSNLNLTASSASLICNYGLWDCQTNNLFAGSSGTPTAFNNYGIVRKSGGTTSDMPYITYFDNNTVFNNWGTVDVQIGGINVYQGTGNGTFIITNKSGLYLGNYNLTNDPTFSGAGILQGYVTGNNAVVHGTENFNYGAFYGTLTLASNNVLTIGGFNGAQGSIGLNGLVLTNYGTVNWGNLNLTTSATSLICNYGLWDCQTNGIFQGSAGTPTIFNNYGMFRKLGGSSIGDKTYLDNQITFNNAGMVDVRVGQLWIAGNYSLTGGTLNFGLTSSTDFGWLYLSGTGSLSGTLSVNLGNGYVPAAGDSFTVVFANPLTGGFTGLNLPPLSPGLIWQTNVGSTMFSLSVTSAPPFTLTTGDLTQGGSGFNFSFAAIPGQIYQVQSTTNLAPANWINLGGPITATNNSVFVSDLIGTNPNRFYRVILQ